MRTHETHPFCPKQQKKWFDIVRRKKNKMWPHCLHADDTIEVGQQPMQVESEEAPKIENHRCIGNEIVGRSTGGPLWTNAMVGREDCNHPETWMKRSGNNYMWWWVCQQCCSRWERMSSDMPHTVHQSTITDATEKNAAAPSLPDQDIYCVVEAPFVVILRRIGNEHVGRSTGGPSWTHAMRAQHVCDHPEACMKPRADKNRSWWVCQLCCSRWERVSLEVVSMLA
jgi:hypothetical protein